MGCSSSKSKEVFQEKYIYTNNRNEDEERIYSDSAINDLYNEFIKKDEFINPFFDEEANDDKIFNILIKREKEQLINAFNLSKSNFMK